MARACSKCSQTDSTPRNFLLTCAACSSVFHHRCHLPVLEDRALIALIKASTQGDHETGLDSWTCAACQCRPPQQLLRPDIRRPPVEGIIDLTLSDSEEDVKPEETAMPLRQPPSYRYNLAPAWMHKRHSSPETTGPADPWDRISTAKRSHSLKRVGKSAARKPTARAKDLFEFSVTVWLTERKAMLSRDVC